MFGIINVSSQDDDYNVWTKNNATLWQLRHIGSKRSVLNFYWPDDSVTLLMAFHGLISWLLPVFE